ncbi:MAG: putative propionyl-CoA carboxylase, partial [Ramlibacter sp.]|nr:putative propionyl-CoA carboxylase [Ramlibacter sp.]
MSWQPEAGEIERRRAFADQLGGPAMVARQHDAGRLTVRERVAGLIDPGSFQEVGRLTGSATYDAGGALQSVTPAPYIMGLAKIDGRDVAIGGEDFTVRGGTSWGSSRRKGGQGGFVEDIAHNYRIPLVNLIDGSGGSVTSAGRRGYSVLPGIHGFEQSVRLLGEVPVVSGVMGTAAGGPAGRAILSHFTVMVKDTSQVFAAGPPVVKRSLGQEISKEELGGSKVAVDHAGTIDNTAENEEAAFIQIRRFLSYMPQNVWELPPPAERIGVASRRRPFRWHHGLECHPHHERAAVIVLEIIADDVPARHRDAAQPALAVGMLGETLVDRLAPS